MAKFDEVDGAAVQGTELPPGYYVVGEYLGTKGADKFTRGTETINVRPKLGVRGPAGDLGIAADSEVALGAAVAGLVIGDRVAVQVRVRPPFGSQGPVKFSLAGSQEGDGWR